MVFEVVTGFLKDSKMLRWTFGDNSVYGDIPAVGHEGLNVSY